MIETTEREFYGGREDRERSPELDFGVWWWEGAAPWGSQWRVSFVDATGELYAVESGGGSPAERRLRILGRFRDRLHVELVLDGWAEVCGGPASLRWVEDRARMARAEERGS